MLPSDDRREPLLPQRAFSAHHHRGPRLSGESDPPARTLRAAEDHVLAADRKGEGGAVNDVVFNPPRQQISANLVEGGKVKVNYPTPQSATQFQNLLEREGIEFDSKGTGSSAWWALLINVLPFVILIAFWIFLMNQVQGGSKVMSFGKSRAKRMSPDSPKVTFKDVAGADEAVEELHEIKEFLENPKKFQALGARIPKGVLLYGPPGTGKTLLARAVAGEAGVPFFSISGSDFVEMFVGVGASRVRDLFEQAKQASPASSSWTRSTPSAGTAARVSAAGTTSASRR